MKIVKAETILLAIPFESGGLAPWGWGGSPANTFDVLLVRLETEDGVVGWGEAFSRMEDRALKQMIDDRVLPLVLGRDAREISRIKHDLEFNPHNFGRIGPIMYGISAVDIALWDLAGKTSWAALTQTVSKSMRASRATAARTRWPRRCAVRREAEEAGSGADIGVRGSACSRKAAVLRGGLG
jgi:L-alanine-DL-glutamate epimerase-like enolase superfamily enzyme